MAVRAVVATLNFYAADYGPGSSPLYSFQNYFPGTKTIFSRAHTYNSFQVGTITAQRDGPITEVDVTFVATAANVDLVETATVNRYRVYVDIFRWGAVENLDNPSTFNLFATFVGDSLGGSADLSTVTLKVGQYTSTVNGDMPWRKIPWTILGPLAFRR